MKKFLNILLIAVLAVILFVNGVILISAWIHPDKVPSFFGWKPFITLSGSMQKEINAGDLAVVKEINPDELKVGDIIAYRYGDIVITHRIFAITTNEEGVRQFTTKGDYNNKEDDIAIFDNMIEGRFEFKVEKLGNVAMFLQTPLGIIIAIAIPVLLLFLVQNNNNKKDAEEGKNMKKEIERLKEENKKLSNKS